MQKTGKSTPPLSISEAAEKLKVSVETIRLYERKGLILIPKTEGNQRFFSESDIERIRCIRKAINDHKISIEGIRRIQSLVPCWEHVGCTTEQRERCPAYFRTDAGCWTYSKETSDKTIQNKCSGRNCRECKVYQLSGDCEKIKSLIHHNGLSQSNPKEE